MEGSYGFPSNFASKKYFISRIFYSRVWTAQKDTNFCTGVVTVLNFGAQSKQTCSCSMIKFWIPIAKIWACIKISDWPNNYYLLQSTLMPENWHILFQTWACIKISDWLNSYFMLQSTLMPENWHILLQTWACIKISDWPNSYYILQSTLMLENWHIL